jgi:Cof subfamily protein (haloacid dehalogenase superfamily)
MSPYRLLAVDLDGTVLGRDATASLPVRDALHRAGLAGVHVMVATGRMVASAQRCWEDLALPPGPAICYQGGEVVQFPDGPAWWRHPLPDEGSRRLAELAVDRGFLCQVYVNNTVWVSRDDERVRHYVHHSRVTFEVRPGPRLTDWPDPPVKLIIQGSAEELTTLRRELEPVAASYGIGLVQTPFLEFVPDGVGKGPALARVAERLGIPQDRVAAAGDGENDADMLEWAGLGIAMGQGHPAALAAADVIAPPVDQDGLATAIDTYILGG